MAKQKHLTLSERFTIQSMLSQSASFKAIGRELNRDCTTISKEVKNHIIFQKKGCFGRAFNDCANRNSCPITNLCEKPNCSTKQCCYCPQCHLHCPDYFKEYCKRLIAPPYCCNGCDKKSKCTLEKLIYSAAAANSEYEVVKSESRSGICVSEEEAIALDNLFSPLLLKGQSIHHICATQPSNVMFSERTIYNYVDAGLFSARNIDMPRKVRFRERKSPHDSFKVDKACRIGRTYEDFKLYLEMCPDTPLVEIDTVEGKKGGKVILTIHFVKAEFMLAFLRERNTAASVFDIFEKLYWELCPDRFMRIFHVILADNGSEFSNPMAIEMDANNNLRARVFYCNPSSPYQKGAIENNHGFIRRVLPKGASFDNLTQEKVNLMMNHINSYHRANLGDRSPYDMFRIIYGQEILDALGATLIPPNDIMLRPELLK